MNKSIIWENITNKEAFRLNELQKQLRGEEFKGLTIAQWKKILKQSDVCMIVKYEGGAIVGMCILRWHDLPGGRSATLEDVVVDPSYRGKGYGESLVTKAIEAAKKNKVDFIDLTSSPGREAANNLYQKLGWQKRETNSYRLYLKVINDK